MGKSKNLWYASMGRPPFEDGDLITPKRNSYRYPDWPHGEYRPIIRVTLDSYDGSRWTLAVLRPGRNSVSFYNPHNFEKKDAEMAAYEKTKYFAMKLSDGIQETNHGLRLDTHTIGPGDMALTEYTTPLRDHRTQVQGDVKARIAEGDRWLVVQTVCLIEGEEPRPPIRITEYK